MPIQKYSIVTLFEPTPKGTDFLASNWLQHVTIADNFTIPKYDDALVQKLSLVAARHHRLVTSAAEDAHFGPLQQVHVTLLTLTPVLRALHDDVIQLLLDEGAVFDDPQFARDGYRPHVTVQKNGRLTAGDEVAVGEITVIDMYPDQDIAKRRVLDTIQLG